jgi:hypothetical protein
LGTESYHEEKVPAEYNLAKVPGKKILVLVNQPVWLDSQTNLRYYLTRAIRQNLIAETKIPQENLITYDKLSEFRSSRSDFSLLSPVEIGKALGVDLVLLILVENCQLQGMAETDYLSGELSTAASLFDVQTGEKVWPQSQGGKIVKVGFEIETKGAEVAVSRLTAASAFCTTRFLYDCPKARFGIAEDKTIAGWENWK